MVTFCKEKEFGFVSDTLFVAVLVAVAILPDRRRPARFARAVTLSAVPCAGQDDRTDTLAGAA